jgi:hypothetical protein
MLLCLPGTIAPRQDLSNLALLPRGYLLGILATLVITET